MKRFFDILISLSSLIVLLPLLLIVVLLVRVKLGSPVFFKQKRPGKDSKIFELIKFRTMLEAYDEEGKPLPNDQRMTKFGRTLRSSSIDELPGLWNVLKGDMSIVGPRPLLVEYLPLYNEFQARRHEVRPGITGWAQVNGRNTLTWEQKFALDVWYVDNQSLWLDLKIVLLTVVKVFKRDGIAHEGDVAMPKFRGSSSQCSTDSK